MSALFHIPQKDPPTFKADNWSPELRSFLEACVHKQPEKRSTALQLLEVHGACSAVATRPDRAFACQHPFLSDGATTATAAVNALISRSLGAVREELDLSGIQARLEIGEIGPASRTTPPVPEDVGWPRPRIRSLISAHISGGLGLGSLIGLVGGRGGNVHSPPPTTQRRAGGRHCQPQVQHHQATVKGASWLALVLACSEPTWL